jgi:hypothetical protein
MAGSRLEQATGAVDGVNRTFATSSDYLAGSLVVFQGLARVDASEADGWTELGGSLFELKVAPRTGNHVGCWYRVI